MNVSVSPERPRLLWFGLGVLALAGVYFGWQAVERRRASGEVSALQGRLSFDDARGAEARAAEPRLGPRLFYEVTLARAPLGGTLDLSCDWIDSAGQVAHRNAWRTRTIDELPWRTHCQWVIPAGARPGAWHVRLRLDERELRSATFEVRE